MPTLDEAARRLDAELVEGDVLLTLGAGNVDDLAKQLT
jgi:UDP-N-acetylmuramate-alanine ligase